DSAIENYQSIIDDLDPSIVVYTLDSQSNGLEQISTIIHSQTDIDALHIISHGNIGEISLGNTLLNTENLSSSTNLLQNIGNSLSQDGDILLYGCSVGESGEGTSFVDSLAQLTNTDVAASDDITGSEHLNGDWDLEYTKGLIETISLSSNSFSGELASQSVDGLNDISIINDSTDIQIAPAIGIANGGDYGNGYIDFDITTGLEAGDTFVLNSTTNDPNDVGEISIVGTDVFLGRGGSTTLIGSVDGTKDGLNGNPLRINFISITIEDLSVVANGDFSQALTTGWTAVTQQVNLGSPLPDGSGIATPTDAQVTYPADNISAATIADDGAVSGYDNPIVQINGGRLELTESSMTIDNFGVIHGPSAYSDTFTGTTGMVLKFDWEANNISDDYHVVGYLVDTSNNITIVLDATGTNGSATATAIIPTDGTYRFVFVSGTFDKTGFTAAGASMYIDNIRVEKPLVIDPVLQALAKQVEFTNANPTVDKVLTISTQNVLGTQANSNLNLTVIQVQPPIPPTLPSSDPQVIPFVTLTDTGTGIALNKNPIEISQSASETPTQEIAKVDSVEYKIKTPDEGIVRSTETTVEVDVNGNVMLDNTVDSIDFRLQKISFSKGEITIDIRDDYRGEMEIYTGTHSNGQILPVGLKIDPRSGMITGVVPDELLDEEGNILIEISAYNESTNETRILKIKLNINDLEKSSPQAYFEPSQSFNEQIALQNDKLNNYGNNLKSLFSNES
ncbi:DUF4347 domain-containing protein, partial [Sulfurimonas sp.]|nr:DUF4347 domain-containing protein [Sulfurimonas sp.]